MRDEAGRIVELTGDTGTSSYTYDDGQGQRTHERSDRAETNYIWDARGWLRGILEDNAQGTTETELSVNAFGELTGVNDTRLHWDIAAGVPSLVENGQVG